MIRKWTENEKEFLRKNYKDMPIQTIAKKLDRSFHAINTYACKLRLKRSEAYILKQKAELIRNSRKHQFKKGSIPHNLGVQMPLEIKEKIKHTFFPKGHIPHNSKPIGTERIDSEDYVVIKVAEPNVWKSKHVFEYEKVHGKVKKGFKVIFADGNKRNFDIDNLLCISGADLLKRNNPRCYPDELQELRLMLKKLNNKINRLTRHEKQYRRP